jgi:hypothetical protein
MEDFLHLLRTIERMDNLPNDESVYLQPSADSIILECEMYANDLLIDSNCQCCWDAIAKLNDNLDNFLRYFKSLKDPILSA